MMNWSRYYTPDDGSEDSFWLCEYCEPEDGDELLETSGNEYGDLCCDKCGYEEDCDE